MSDDEDEDQDVVPPNTMSPRPVAKAGRRATYFNRPRSR